MTFWKGRTAAAPSQPPSHFSTAKQSCSLEEYSFSLNTLTQAGDFDILICAVKAGAGTKAAAKPRLVPWQKATAPKKLPEGGGEGFSAGKVVGNGLGLFGILPGGNKA